MIKKMILMMIFISSAFAAANACDFDFKVNDNKKSCRPGEVLEVTVELSLTHRVCNVAPSQTKFKIDGFKVVGASEWKQISPTKYVRTIKIEVLNDKKKDIKLMAIRTCSKEGGSGILT